MLCFCDVAVSTLRWNQFGTQQTVSQLVRIWKILAFQEYEAGIVDNTKHVLFLEGVAQESNELENLEVSPRKKKASTHRWNNQRDCQGPWLVRGKKQHIKNLSVFFLFKGGFLRIPRSVPILCGVMCADKPMNKWHTCEIVGLKLQQVLHWTCTLETANGIKQLCS